MQRGLRHTLATLVLAGQLAAAAPTQETTQACTDIQNALPGKVLTPGLLAAEYTYETQQYWSMTPRSDDPACIVQPASAEDVSTVIKTLLKYPTVKFATRSGGHDPNVGHASVQDGVLITMTEMVGATYDAAKEVAYVKPGGEWNDVVGDLEPSGVTILGGRLGIVGVGGLLLGGGLSFLSAQRGLAADNIIGWETVMANGSVVNVDATAHPDLAQALRGSGSQFGVVTTFTVKTKPMTDIWGGSCIYDSATQSEALYAALHNFVANGAQDPKAAIIFTDLLLAEGISTKLIYYFYDAPTPPASGPFADFFKIVNPLCLPKTQKYSELVRANGAPVALLQARASFRTYTLPFIPTRPQMYSEIQAKFAQITKPFLSVLRPTSQFSVDFQPFPSVIGKFSASAGGNAYGLSSSDADIIILEIQGSWLLPEDDAVAYDLSKQLTDWLDEEVPKWLDEAGMSDVYRPLYLNDAAGDQPVMQSWRDYAKLKALQEKYDPTGLFSGRAGGFKY